jgi:predicted tellurium resistance membrane protein TerC
MQWLEIIVSLLALIMLELLLGIDNLVFLAILTERLPLIDRKKARQWGLTFAWVTRIFLLATAVWIAKLKYPILILLGFSFSFRDLFLILGGAFLLMKATQEIHQEVLHDAQPRHTLSDKQKQFWSVVVQVGLMDVIFSIDSVLTAIGLTNQFWIMATAITCAILVMIFASELVGRFIKKYPTIKMLALSFLMLIGMVLVADGFSFYVPRAYIYFAMGFSLTVEALNLMTKSKKTRRKKTHALD